MSTRIMDEAARVFADPQAYVNLILDHVEPAIREHHPDIDIRMFLQKIRDDGQQIKPSERDWRG